MLKQLNIPPIILFVAPILAAVGLFAFLNFSGQTRNDDVSGSLKLLYTSEVGGRLDPCG